MWKTRHKLSLEPIAGRKPGSGGFSPKTKERNCPAGELCFRLRADIRRVRTNYGAFSNLNAMTLDFRHYGIVAAGHITVNPIPICRNFRRLPIDRNPPNQRLIDLFADFALYRHLPSPVYPDARTGS
jgi:hypothetical protein